MNTERIESSEGFKGSRSSRSSGGSEAFRGSEHSLPAKHRCKELLPDLYQDTGMKIYGSGKPVRLFVAGLHGNEWKDTTGFLKSI